MNVLRRKTNHNVFTEYINKQKDANNKTEYEESSVTHEVLSCFNIFDFGRNILNRLDVKYEQVFMAATKEKYHTKIF